MLLQIIIAIAFPLLLVAFLIYRNNLAKKIANLPQSSVQPEAGSMIQMQKSKGGASWVIAGLLAIGLIVYIIQAKPFNSSSSKFSPEELVELMINYNTDNIASQCIDKKFIEQKSEVINYHEQTSRYGYYFISNNPKESEIEEVENADRTFPNFKEYIAIWDNERSIYYATKDQKVYEKFITFIKEKTNATAWDGKLIDDDDAKYYKLDDIIVIDEGFSRDAKKYSIYMMNIDELRRINAKIIQDSLNAQEAQIAIEHAKQDSIAKFQTDLKAFNDAANATISVSVAKVRTDKYSHSSVTTTLKTGTKIKVLKQVDDMYYCDYRTEDGNAGTGWVNILDLKVNDDVISH